MNNLNTLAVVAKELGVSYPTVLRHADAGNLRTLKIGIMHLVTTEDLERFKAWYAVHGGRWGAK
jgi:excisionase family DNA binding protein